MGEPVYLQFAIRGGFDQKTSKIYLDPEQNQENILNGNFSYVGQVDKRQGIQFQVSLSVATTVYPPNPSTAYSYNVCPPSSSASTAAGFGNLLFQPEAAWTVPASGTTATYVGQLPNCKPVRRPLPMQGSIVPLLLDGVASTQGTSRVMAWLNTDFSVSTALIDPATGSSQVLFAPIPAVANVTSAALITLLPFPSLPGTTVALFVVNNITGPTRAVYCYTIDPTVAGATWTLQSTFNTYHTAANTLDAALFNGDPNNGYLLLYAPTSDVSALKFSYFRAFSGTPTTSGTITSGGGVVPTGGPVYIQADWGIDCVFTWADSVTNWLHLAYYSADAVFTAGATHTLKPSDVSFPVISNPIPEITGICRTNPNSITGLDSEIYLAFTEFDDAYYSSSVPFGPLIPLTMGGLVQRTGASVTVPAGEWALYPAGLVPISHPMQPADSFQVSNEYIHIAHPCIQTYLYQLGLSDLHADQAYSLQATEYMVEWRGQQNIATNALATITATVAPRQISPFPIGWWNQVAVLVPHVTIASSADKKKCITPIIIGASGVSANTQTVPTFWAVDFSFTDTTGLYQVENINNTSQVSGAVPMRLHSAGTSGAAGAAGITEHGFVHYPEFMFATDATGTGITGTYFYAVCYLRQDSNGNIERSSPVAISAPIVPSNKSVTLIFPLLSWWNDRPSTLNGYQVEIYKSQTLGSTLNCMTRIPSSQIAISPLSPIMGTFVDDGTIATDAAVAKSEILYTTGQVLDNVNPPSALFHVSHRGRYAIVDETLRQVWFTKQETADEVLAFNEVLISPFLEGGDITGLSSMDDKFIVWKASSIQVQYGDGPADNGQNSDWTIPQPVLTDVGCINAASLATIPSGIIFQSSIGFHILTRSLEVQYIGKNVQDLVKQYPTCVSSVVVPSAKQVRWCMSDGELQLIIVYDYLLNEWTSHSYPYITSIVQLLLVNGVYTVIDALGRRWVESATSWKDKDSAGSFHFVPTSVTLPFVKIQGPQGYMRARFIQLLCTVNDPCGVKMDLAFNYDATIQQSKSWTYEGMAGGRRVETHVGACWNKCESVQVTVTDVDDTSSSTGQGMTFAAIGFDMEKIADRYRRNAARLKG